MQPQIYRATQAQLARGQIGGQARLLQKLKGPCIEQMQRIAQSRRRGQPHPRLRHGLAGVGHLECGAGNINPPRPFGAHLALAGGHQQTIIEQLKRAANPVQAREIADHA